MKLALTFKESDQSFDPHFGEVHSISDGGFERGYAQGYDKGTTDGYTKGHTDGVKDGYAEGYDVGNAEGNAIATSIVDRSIEKFINPVISIIGNRVFFQAGKLTLVDCQSATEIQDYAFGHCQKLSKARFPSARKIAGYAFDGCTLLKTVILEVNVVCSLSATSAFSRSPIANGKGYIYVPKALVEQYKTATNWSTYADQIRAIEDYPEITSRAKEDKYDPGQTD